LKGENKIEKLNEEYLNKFKLSLEDDLNTAQALATLWEMLKDSQISDSEKYFTALKMDEVLSLDLGKKLESEISPEIQKLIDLRNKYREEKNYAEADRLRDELKSLGYEAKDK
jgi:cysteinyl-tRNA synthetase